MNGSVPGRNKTGLHDEKKHPCRKQEAVHVEERGKRRRAVEALEVVASREADKNSQHHHQREACEEGTVCLPPARDRGRGSGARSCCRHGEESDHKPNRDSTEISGSDEARRTGATRLGKLSVAGRKTMILVTAATGQYGRLVVEALLQKAASKDLAVAVRHPEKARDWRARGVGVRQADYDDLSSLHAAFEGINDLLFISSPEFDTPTRMAQHERVIEGAKRG